MLGNGEKLCLRRAGTKDLPGIMQVLEQAGRTAPPGWFVTDEEEYIRYHLEGRGFVLVALGEGEKIAGFLMVDLPEKGEDSLGKDAGLAGEQLLRVAHMDAVAVLPEYRGNYLQERLLKAAEKELKTKPEYCFFMATVHPENIYSLRNFQRLGYRVAATVRKYGGLPRYVLLKEKGEEE